MRKVFIFLLVVGVLMLGTLALFEDVADEVAHGNSVHFSGEPVNNCRSDDQTLFGESHGGDGAGPIPG